MKKLSAILMTVALFSSTLTGVSAKTTNRSNLQPIAGLMSAARQTAATDDKRVWHLTVESREDIGETAAEFKADLKEAFEDLGDTVVEKASDDSIDLHFYLGKDDADDDNDGTLDAKDVGDANDGEADATEAIEEINLDKEAGNLTDDFADKDKSSGIYFEIDGVDGIDMRFESSADSLEDEGDGGMASAILGNGVFLNKASFSPIEKFTALIPSADCLRQKMALRATLARCKNAACKTSVNTKANSLGCI